MSVSVAPAPPPAPPRPVRAAGAHPAVPAATAVLLAGVGYYLRFGYRFGEGDHDDLLPELLRALDPALFPTDPFVADRVGGVSVRGVFVGMLRALSLVLPVPVAVAVLHAAVFAATAWGVYRLTRVLVPALPLAALLAPTAALVAVGTWALGSNTLVYPTLAPEGVAWALVLPALVALLEGRRVLPAVLVALAAWVHPVTGLVVALALGLTLLWEAAAARAPARALRGAVVFGGVFLVAAAPGVLPVVLGQAGEAAGGVPTGYDLFVRFRLPHHLLPTAFGAGAWVRFGLLLLAGGGALLALHRRVRLRHGGFVARFLVVVAAVCAAAAVGVVGLESLAVARAQAFKLTVLAGAVLAGGACGGLAEAAAALPPRLRAWAEWPARRPRAVLAAAGGLALLVVVLALADVGRPGARYGPRAHARSDLGRVEAWARRATPPAALFLVPPSTTTFRVGARRGVVVTWKAHPFRADRMRAWLALLRTVAPVPGPAPGVAGPGHLPRLDAAYCANDAEDWARIARRTGAGWAVVGAGCGAPAAPAAFRAGRVAVHPLR